MLRELISWQLRRWLYRPSFWLARCWPTQPALSLVRWVCRIQISAEQLTLISKTIKGHPGCKLLVFGLGNDSPLWHSLNKGGVTMFLEDDRRWFHDVTTRQPSLKAFLVAYGTRLTEWKELLHCPALLRMEFPKPVIETEWDAILVDAPAGRAGHFPGRMKSIYAASRLIKKSGDVFVHDCEREVEKAYCDYYLKPENQQAELTYTEGWLRHYRQA